MPIGHSGARPAGRRTSCGRIFAAVARVATECTASGRSSGRPVAGHGPGCRISSQPRALTGAVAKIGSEVARRTSAQNVRKCRPFPVVGCPVRPFAVTGRPDASLASAPPRRPIVATYPERMLEVEVLEGRLADLAARLRGLGSVLVAFSGGADSAFLLAAAVRALEPDRVLAATAVADCTPPHGLARAAGAA